MFEEYIGKRVIVRTYSAGVHFGTLAARDGKEVELQNTRRIWEWRGAFTLSAIALGGIVAGKLSEAIPSILLTEAIEIIPCSEGASASLMDFRAHRP